LQAEIDSRVDLDRLKELTAGDMDFIKMLLSEFLSDTDEKLVALKKAIDGKDYEGQKAKAHSIRGAALNLGCAQLAEPCDFLEYDEKAEDQNIAKEKYQILEEEYQITRQAIEQFCNS